MQKSHNQAMGEEILSKWMKTLGFQAFANKVSQHFHVHERAKVGTVQLEQSQGKNVIHFEWGQLDSDSYRQPKELNDLVQDTRG